MYGNHGPLRTGVLVPWLRNPPPRRNTVGTRDGKPPSDKVSYDPREQTVVPTNSRHIWKLTRADIFYAAAGILAGHSSQHLTYSTVVLKAVIIMCPCRFVSTILPSLFSSPVTPRESGSN